MVAGLMLTAGFIGPAQAQCSRTWISSGLKQERIDATNQDLTQPPWNFMLVSSPGGGTFNTSVTLSAAPPSSSWPITIWESATGIPAAQLLQLPSAPPSYPHIYPVTVTVPTSLSSYNGQPYFYFTVYTSKPSTCTIP